MSSTAEVNTFISNLEDTSAGYKSWGEVVIITIVTRSNLASVGDRKMYEAIFAKRKNINCIIITRQQYASRLKEEVPPILDDQTQLLGVSIRMADISDESKSIANVLYALKSRFAAVLSDGRCICLGGTIDDTYIAAQLLEKTSKAFLEAKYLGGAKSINRIEAWAMQMYFQFKYAKEAKKNR